jgi:hypothetical protein
MRAFVRRQLAEQHCARALQFGDRRGITRRHKIDVSLRMARRGDADRGIDVLCT